MKFLQFHLNPEFLQRLEDSNKIFDGYKIDHAPTTEVAEDESNIIFSTWNEPEVHSIVDNLIYEIKREFKKQVVLSGLGDNNIMVILRCFSSNEYHINDVETFMFIITNEYLRSDEE